MKSPPPFHGSPHISILLLACTSSLAYFRDKEKKNVLCNDPLTKELQGKDSRSPRSPLDLLHLGLRIPASHRFSKGGIAETLDCETMKFQPEHAAKPQVISNKQRVLRVHPVFYHNLIRVIERATVLSYMMVSQKA